MQMRLALLAAAVLLLAAPATAHVTTTVDPLAGPLVVGQPTEVTVHFSEPCFEVLPQEEVDGISTVMAGLAPEAPATIIWVGETVPLTFDMCDPTAVPFALVRATAKLTLTPTAAAPGEVLLALPVTSYLGGGTEPGETVLLNATVAYFANATLAAGNASRNGTGYDIPLTLSYVSNADSVLTVGSTTSAGKVDAIAPLDLTSPSVQNKTEGHANLTARFVPTNATWTTASIAFEATLAPKGNGTAQVVRIQVPLLNPDPAPGSNGTMSSGHHDHGHEHDEQSTPAPALGLVAVAVAAVAASRRRP